MEAIAFRDKQIGKTGVLFFKAAEIYWFPIAPQPTGAVKLGESLTKTFITDLIYIFCLTNALVGRSRGLL